MNPCPLTCAYPKPRPCPYAAISKGGCECAPDFVLNEANGKCIRPKDCPGQKCKDPNAVNVDCPNPCPLSCDRPFPRVCNKACVKKGCQCASGYILDIDDIEQGKCVRPKDCPAPICCPKHSHYVIEDNQCQKTCGNRLMTNSDVAGACVPFTGCSCKSGYVRLYDNATGPCIPETKCPPIPTECGTNEEPTSCRIICPPQTCDSIFTLYSCEPTECQPGCNCKNGYLRNKDGICILSEDCFKPDPIECGENEIACDCAIQCPPQSCESLYTTYLCAETNCTAGCNCIDGYLRNSLGVCVPSEECYNDPAGCEGDVNATRASGCVSPYPPTCKNPDPKVHSDICQLNGCECKPGYIKSCKDGNCIESTDCPGGSPKCGANQTYVGCKFGCPTNYCPVDDSRAIVACSIAYPCQGGCACKGGYLIVSRDEPQCVLASDCPDIKCTRPNEVLDRNPSSCFFERCEDRDSECISPYPLGPRCVCEDGYYRNESDICIPVSECPPLGCNDDLNATYTDCPSYCPPSCDDIGQEPMPCVAACAPAGCQCNPGYVLNQDGICINPEDCPGCEDPNAVYKGCPSACEPTCAKPDRNQACTRQCMPPGCVCKSGFVLNEKTGKCVKPETCPVIGCGGDPNAVYKDCVSACEPTCTKPDPQICTLQCLPSGCVCKKGYVKNEATGKCVKRETCPDPAGCEGDVNATRASGCVSPYPPTCKNPDPKVRSDICQLNGCECKPGYIKSCKDGNCIESTDCPGGSPNCGANQTYTGCKFGCPTNYCPVDDSRGLVACSLPYLCQGGCACMLGYLIVSYDNPQCVLASDCPDVKCTRPNEVLDRNPSSCFFERCEDRNSECNSPYPLGPRCVCEDGYYRNESDICIPVSECPPLGCNDDLNATYTVCPSYCPPSCDDIGQEPMPCIPACAPAGCQCNPGYVLNQDGICINPEDCPVIGCGGDRNAVYKDCVSACEPTCTKPDPQICTLQCLPSGCVCKKGYVKNEATGKCVKRETCPVVGCNGDGNSTYTGCRSYCPPSCDDIGQEPKACIAACAPAGCACNPGYVLNQDGICINPEDCPVESGCEGDRNATRSDCSSACPPICGYNYSKEEKLNCANVCDLSICECKQGYMLTEIRGLCVKPEDCPGCKGDLNAVFSDCPSACELNCTNPKPRACTEQCMPPGCVCKSGHVLNEKTGKCVKPETCPGNGCKGDPNAMYSECPSACEPTCTKSDPNQPCTYQCLSPGCVCMPGYVLNEKTGKCVKPETCPAEPQCNGDRNATYVESPENCQPTCKNPEPEEECMDMSTPPACICKTGYIFNKKGGRCIKPEDCPGGSPKCKANETYVYCNAGCPTDYCPTDDSLAVIACDPPYPCLGGCACIGGYLVVSENDERCILSSECPKIKCSRPNEFWDAYAPSCLRERCDDRDIPCDFYTFYPAPPRCRCIEGYYRNQDDICVPECQCPKPGCNGDLNATFSECPSECPATCGDPPNQGCTAVCAEPGCICNEGFVLSKPGGVCIRSEDCGQSTPVCGMNEIARDCRRICPPQTCLSKYALIRCVADLPCEPGCDCVPNYLRNDKGICIPSEKCPPLEPEPTCGYNEVSVPCRQICPPQNCEIAYTDYACTEETKICEPGCDCLPDHLRNGSGICIPNDQCPYPSTPVCGINEIARDCKQICPPQSCRSKYIEYSCLQYIACEPGCDCVANYLRNDKGICIPSEKCPPPPCPISDKCQRTCASPNPPNCGYNPPKENINGCDCKEGYILSEEGGDCIPIENCPPEVACNGDPNAVPKRCPKPCPSTCDSPDQTPCKRACDPIACECKPGHLLSNETGLCILPEKCPGGNPCGKNARFADCKTDCPDDYCPVDDSRALVFCDPPASYCLSGCICDLNNKRKSRKNPKCITSSKCRPVNCTRPNEEWNSCPSACLAENCEDVDNQPITCNTLVLNCQPRCVCTKNHFRNSSGICIPANDCPKGCDGDLNAVFNQCPSACEPTCNTPQFEVCTDQCMEPGCVCKPGFVLNEEDGQCTELENCPVPECEDVNAVFKSCPSACEPTCASPDPHQVCTEECKPARCVCKAGFVLNEQDGKCVKPEHCPAC